MAWQNPGRRSRRSLASLIARDSERPASSVLTSGLHASSGRAALRCRALQRGGVQQPAEHPARVVVRCSTDRVQLTSESFPPAHHSAHRPGQRPDCLPSLTDDQARVLPTGSSASCQLARRPAHRPASVLLSRPIVESIGCCTKAQGKNWYTCPPAG